MSEREGHGVSNASSVHRQRVRIADAPGLAGPADPSRLTSAGPSGSFVGVSGSRDSPFGAVHLDAVDVAQELNPNDPTHTDGLFHQVRRHFDVRAFGVDPITANTDEELVEPHDELVDSHEELFAVMSGRAVFTVDGEDLEAPAGTLVFVRDPALTRSARALLTGRRSWPSAHARECRSRSPAGNARCIRSAPYGARPAWLGWRRSGEAVPAQRRADRRRRWQTSRAQTAAPVRDAGSGTPTRRRHHAARTRARTKSGAGRGRGPAAPGRPDPGGKLALRPRRDRCERARDRDRGAASRAAHLSDDQADGTQPVRRGGRAQRRAGEDGGGRHAVRAPAPPLPHPGRAHRPPEPDPHARGACRARDAARLRHRLQRRGGAQGVRGGNGPSAGRRICCCRSTRPRTSTSPARRVASAPRTRSPPPARSPPCPT